MNKFMCPLTSHAKPLPDPRSDVIDIFRTFQQLGFFPGNNDKSINCLVI